ncbi:hypothetical protein D3C87_1165450 [compost metagenome]
MAVIKTGLKRMRQPSRTARSTGMPSATSLLSVLTRMTPFCTATPKSAMKPTEALTLRCCPDKKRAAMPPMRANGMFKRIRAACGTEPKVPNSRRKIRPMTTGTTTESVPMARCWLSNWPPQVVQ